MFDPLQTEPGADPPRVMKWMGQACVCSGLTWAQTELEEGLANFEAGPGAQIGASFAKNTARSTKCRRAPTNLEACLINTGSSSLRDRAVSNKLGVDLTTLGAGFARNWGGLVQIWSGFGPTCGGFDRIRSVVGQTRGLADRP